MGFEYARVSVNGQRLYLHRLVAEQKLGRKILPDEHVHHVNGDKRDNRPENLEVVSAARHNRNHRHRAGTGKHNNPTEYVCEECNASFQIDSDKASRYGKNRPKVCSKKCQYGRLSRVRKGSAEYVEYARRGAEARWGAPTCR